MRQYLPRAIAKEVRGGKALFLLAVAGVALGVASVLSIQLLDASALGAFSGTVRAVSGDADLSVLPWAGALDEALLDEVLSVPGVATAAPVYRADVAVEGRPGVTLEIAGVDPSRRGEGRGSWRRRARAGARDARLDCRLLGVGGRAGWRAGDRLGVSLGSRRAVLVIGAVVDLRAGRAAREPPPRAHGPRAGAGPPRWARAGSTRSRSARRRGSRRTRWRSGSPRASANGAGCDAGAADGRGGGALAAFRLNLTALSLVSLLVGGFLVYASVRASLARRREELGVLRAVGATRAQVVGLVLGEAALLGALGTAAGHPARLARRPGQPRRGLRHGPEPLPARGDRAGRALAGLCWSSRWRPARAARWPGRSGLRSTPGGPIRARSSRRSPSRSELPRARGECSPRGSWSSRRRPRSSRRPRAAGRPPGSCSRWGSSRRSRSPRRPGSAP